MDNFELAKKYFFEGVGDLDGGLFQEAEDKFLESLKLLPDRASTLSNLAAAKIKLRKFAEAKIAAEQALVLEVNNFEAHLNLGVIAKEEGHLILAIEHFTKALHINPYIEQAYLNNGAALKELRRYDDALSSYEKALTINPNYAEAWSNKGAVYSELKLYDEALASYEKALSLNPDYAEAWTNKGVVYSELKLYDEALAAHMQALTINSNYAEAWSNKGVVYSELKLYDDALSSYEKALSLNPSINYLPGQIIHTKMLSGNWAELDSMSSDIGTKISDGLKVGMPFSVLSALDAPKTHLESSKIWVNDKYPTNFSLPPINKKLHRKIRLGYFSADFGNHPVSALTSELFKIHNRDCFEVFALSLKNAGKNDLMREKLIPIFDRFIDVDNLSDISIAKLSRELEIDIAIDMSGHTLGARTGIFSYRAAPIQVNYLGYPGTIGADYIDYIIADHTVIPESSSQYYTEKIAYLPDTYMVDDSTRKISQRKFTREDFGLPINGVIFCAFNNSYKFNQKLLSSWSRILLSVPNSVLWVSENNSIFKRNLLDEFKKLGVEFNRIIFAKRLESAEDHLKRHQLADLFLDTTPYNAHTSGVDSLKAGLPVVTLLGNAFPGRVAASLLRAIGLERLITRSQEEYEALVIQLATNPQALRDLKEELQGKLITAPLFDTSLFVKNIEAAYAEMYKRYQRGLDPDHIDIMGID